MAIKKQQQDTEKLTAEIGTSGLNRWGGQIKEEFLTELQGLRGIRTYEEMRRNDPTVGSFLFAIEMNLRRMRWKVKPANSSKEALDAADFLESCLDDMSHTWNDFLSEVVTFLPFGWAWFEIVYKLRKGENEDEGLTSKFSDGKIGWRKFAFRSQLSWHDWIFDDEGGIKAMVQMAPPDFKIREIPIWKSLLFRTSKEANNPFGVSVLRTAYRAYYFKTNLEQMEGIVLERRGAGFPVMKLPETATDEDLEKAKDIVRKIRVDEQMGLTLPYGWDFEFKSPTSDLTDFRESITRYRYEMLLSVLAQFLVLGAERVGSYALGRSLKDFFLDSLNGWADNIAETFNKFAVERLMKLNGFKPEVWPKVIHSGALPVDLESLMKFLQPAIELGLITPDDNLQDYLRLVARLPEALENRLQKKNLLSREVVKAEDWHPNYRPNQEKLIKLENDFEEAIVKFMKKFSGWLAENYMDVYRKVEKADVPEEWDQWVTEFAKTIQEPISLCLGLGGESAKNFPAFAGLTIDWSLQNENAIRWMRARSLEVASSVFDTVRDSLRESLSTGLKFGEGLPELKDRVEELVTDITSWKAKQIAQTETIRAYTQGSLQVYKESGIVEKKVWLDGQAGACPHCRELNNKIIGLDEAFGGVGEDVDGPPAHPGCRCSIGPWLGDTAPSKQPSLTEPLESLLSRPMEADKKFLGNLEFVEGNKNRGANQSWILRDKRTNERWYIKTSSHDELANEIIAERLGKALGINMPDVRFVKKVPPELAGDVELRANREAITMIDWNSKMPKYEFKCYYKVDEVDWSKVDNANEFFKMPYFDFLINNHDRHGGNWMIGTNKQSENYYVGLIDNSLSLYYVAAEDREFYELKDPKKQLEWVIDTTFGNAQGMYDEAEKLSKLKPEIAESARLDIINKLQNEITDEKIEELVKAVGKLTGLSKEEVSEKISIIKGRRQMLIQTGGKIY